MGEKQVVGGSQLPVCPGLHGVASFESKRGLSYFDTRSKTARTLQQAEAPTVKMTSNEVLAQRIEALVREHIAESRRTPQEALSRAFSSATIGASKARFVSKEGGIRRPVQARATAGREEGEHILFLFARRVADRHDALGEEIAAFALRAERAFSPENESPKLTLAVVVGSVDVVALTKVQSSSR